MRAAVDETHCLLLQRFDLLWEEAPLSELLLPTLQRLSAGLIKEDPAFEFAPIAVQSNQERHLFNRLQTERFARKHGRPIFRWVTPLLIGENKYETFPAVKADAWVQAGAHELESTPPHPTPPHPTSSQLTPTHPNPTHPTAAGRDGAGPQVASEMVARGCVCRWPRVHVSRNASATTHHSAIRVRAADLTTVSATTTPTTDSATDDLQHSATGDSSEAHSPEEQPWRAIPEEKPGLRRVLNPRGPPPPPPPPPSPSLSRLTQLLASGIVETQGRGVFHIHIRPPI